MSLHENSWLAILLAMHTIHAPNCFILLTPRFISIPHGRSCTLTEWCVTFISFDFMFHDSMSWIFFLYYTEPFPVAENKKKVISTKRKANQVWILSSAYKRQMSCYIRIAFFSFTSVQELISIWMSIHFCLGVVFLFRRVCANTNYCSTWCWAWEKNELKWVATK